MAFETEPIGYTKTVLSDLQGAWQNLRTEVAEQAGFPGWEKALFHIDEAMSWEAVRNLASMQKCLVLVRNILQHPDVPEGVRVCLEEVNGWMEETAEALKEGKID